MKFNSTLLLTIAILALTARTTQGQDSSGTGTSTEESPPPYPFEPPSAEFCHHNKLGDDLYISFFSPCNFTFYKGPVTTSDANSFSCVGIVNNTNEEIISIEERRVVAWPDSCVADGPRCYNLSEYPNLSNFTLFGQNDDYYQMKFPNDASYVSVDCSNDYRLAKEAMDHLPPDVMEPLKQAIIFFGIMIVLVIIVIVLLCCACCGGCGGRRRQGYTNINRNVYEGPPVQATKITV
jgi:hypothetical protein